MMNEHDIMPVWIGVKDLHGYGGVYYLRSTKHFDPDLVIPVANGGDCVMLSGNGDYVWQDCDSALFFFCEAEPIPEVICVCEVEEIAPVVHWFHEP